MVAAPNRLPCAPCWNCGGGRCYTRHEWHAHPGGHGLCQPCYRRWRTAGWPWSDGKPDVPPYSPPPEEWPNVTRGRERRARAHELRQRGFTVTRIAVELGVARQTVWGYLAGDR